MKSLAVVLLAAGQGSRMKSKKQKILHEVGGRPMVAHVFAAAEEVSDQQPVLVVAPGETGVHQLFGQRAEYVVQPEQKGTGHATLMALPLLQGKSDQVLVTYGDMPLLRAETMSQLAGLQANSGAALAMLTVAGSEESSFGRVVRNPAGRVTEIVEVAEARQRANTNELLAITELNAGVYCFDAGWLWDNVADLPLRRARSGPEYYLTDMVGLAVGQGRVVAPLLVEDADECLGAGTRQELVAVEQAFRRRANAHWLDAGVTLVDPDTTFIDLTVTIGQDTIVWPNTYLQGHTTIGEACTVGPNTIIRDAQIGDECVIEQAVVERVHVKAGTHVPPFSHLNRGWDSRYRPQEI